MDNHQRSWFVLFAIMTFLLAASSYDLANHNSDRQVPHRLLHRLAEAAAVGFSVSLGLTIALRAMFLWLLFSTVRWEDDLDASATWSQYNTFIVGASQCGLLLGNFYFAENLQKIQLTLMTFCFTNTINGVAALLHRQTLEKLITMMTALAAPCFIFSGMTKLLYPAVIGIVSTISASVIGIQTLKYRRKQLERKEQLERERVQQ